MRTIRLLIFAFVLLEMASGDTRASQPALPRNTVLLGYSLRLPLSPAQQPVGFGKAMDATEAHAKSPFLAGLLSFIVPGLGEYYVGDSYWRGAIFTLGEIGLWYGRYHWIARGDDSTVAFRAFGDAHWSEARYLNYVDTVLTDHGLPAIDPNGGLAAVHAAEDTLNYLSLIDGDPDVKNFTHHLPEYGTQQYYELMSKYWQFTAGWDDATSQNPESSPHDMRHAEMRENMNEQYTIADYFLYGIILNHFLSAIDAAIIASNHNARIRVMGSLQQQPMSNGTIGLIPTAHVSYLF